MLQIAGLLVRTIRKSLLPCIHMLTLAMIRLDGPPSLQGRRHEERTHGLYQTSVRITMAQWRFGRLERLTYMYSTLLCFSSMIQSNIGGPGDKRENIGVQPPCSVCSSGAI